MQPKDLPPFKSAREALDAGIAEADRREGVVTDARGERHWSPFDGLLGVLDPANQESILLRGILAYLRDYLLDRYSDEQARSLLETFEPRPGYRNMPVVDDDVLLAIDLLNMVCSAVRCEGERFSMQIFGKAGARDQKRQAGARKERRPEISEWIDARLKRSPYAKTPELWAMAPDWITDQIGRDRFAKRVTARRKLRRK